MCAAFALAACAGTAAARSTADSERLVAEMLGWTKLNRRAIVSVEPELIAALLTAPKRDPATGALQDAVLQGEVTSDETAQAYGWRSMRVRLDVSCTTLSDRVLEMQVFPDHNGTGAPRALAPPVGWIRPSAHTYAADVIDLLCGRGASASSSSIGPSSIGPSSIGLSSKRQGLIAQARPPASPRMPTPAETAPAMGRNPARREGQISHPAPPVAAGGVLAQLAALGSQASADELLARLAAKHGPELSTLHTRVDPVSVQGKSYYRVVVLGFTSPAAATAFCTQVRDLSNGCILRRSGG